MVKVHLLISLFTVLKRAHFHTLFKKRGMQPMVTCPLPSSNLVCAGQTDLTSCKHLLEVTFFQCHCSLLMYAMHFFLPYVIYKEKCQFCHYTVCT